MTPPKNENNLSPEQNIREFLGVSMGSWREYRPGKWKLKFWFNGELIELYSNKDGDTLESSGMCARTMAYIEELIKEKRFHPKTWQKTQKIISLSLNSKQVRPPTVY